jgi:hypothetical protein
VQIKELKICQRCNFPYENLRLDPFLRLHFPQTKGLRYSFSLKELIDYNFDVKLEDVNCIVCRTKTKQVRQSTVSEELVIIEIMRGTDGLRVNRASIIFDHKEINFPRSTSSYQVIATAHHAGGVSQGHWKAKLKTRSGWTFSDIPILLLLLLVVVKMMVHLLY